MVTQASGWEAIPVKRCRFVESLGYVYTHMRYILEHQPSSLRHQCKQTVTVLTGALLPNPQGHTHTQKSKQPHSQWQADTHWDKNTVYRAYVCVSLWGVGLCSNMSLPLVRDSWVGVGILVSASVLWPCWGFHCSGAGQQRDLEVCEWEEEPVQCVIGLLSLIVYNDVWA